MRAGVYNTEVTLAEQCGDLMQNLWENMVVDYELPSYNHTFKKNIVVRSMLTPPSRLDACLSHRPHTLSGLWMSGRCCLVHSGREGIS